MTFHQTPYSDAESTQEMSADAHQVEHNLQLGRRAVPRYSTELLGEQPPASARLQTRYEVSDDLARMADGLELHFD